MVTTMRGIGLAALLSVWLAAPAFAGNATVEALSGSVKIRPPGAQNYDSVARGQKLQHGARVKTGKDGRATLKFEDGSKVEVRPESEILVRAPETAQKPNGVLLFFGRVWSKVTKSAGGSNSFEVQSANAVAGVRGTDFEVGVADDGSTRVVVSNGKVTVEGDDQGGSELGPGDEVESDGEGELSKKKRSGKDADWNGWFAARAKALEKEGLKVAKNLDGRLERRRAKVEALVKEQRALRKQIESLEAQRAEGADVEADLQDALAKLERVTERLQDMEARLQSAYGMFERWGAVAEKGGMDGAEELGRMAHNIARVAADFADMIEEGTDQSEEGMDEMLQEMPGGGTLKPKKKGAKHELLDD